MIAPGGNGCDFHIDAIHPPVGVHVQFGDEAAPDETYSHLCHPRAPQHCNNS
jgi:hypothetical protein